MVTETIEQFSGIEKPLSRKEVCELLEIGQKSLQLKMKDEVNPIPHHGAARFAKFYRSEINEWIRSTGKPSLLRRIK